MSVIIDLAKAVADAIEAATLPMTVTVTREFTPKTKRDQAVAADAEAIVIPRSRSFEPLDRGRRQIVFGIDVGIRKRGVTAENIEELDDLMNLVEAITNLFEQKRLAGMDTRCIATTADPIFDPAMITDYHVFMAPITFSFLVWEDV